MSVYNSEKYLSESIDSILYQTFENFEFIIINDGSTDKSSDILYSYAKKDSRINIIRNDINIGLTKSINKGIAVAKGKYIARMDSDDISYPNRLEKQFGYLENNNEIICLGTEVLLIDPAGRPIGKRNHPIDHDEIQQRLFLGDGGAITHPSIMCRRDALEKIDGYDERFTTAQDLDLYLRFSEIGKLKNIPDVLLKWRQHPNSINHTKYQTWREMKLMALRNTMKRQGVEVDLALVDRDYQLAEDLYITWAYKALNNKYFLSAISNFLISIMKYGFNYKQKIFLKKIIKKLVF